MEGEEKRVRLRERARFIQATPRPVNPLFPAQGTEMAGPRGKPPAATRPATRESIPSSATGSRSRAIPPARPKPPTTKPCRALRRGPRRARSGNRAVASPPGHSLRRGRRLSGDGQREKRQCEGIREGMADGQTDGPGNEKRPETGGSQARAGLPRKRTIPPTAQNHAETLAFFMANGDSASHGMAVGFAEHW